MPARKPHPVVPGIPAPRTMVEDRRGGKRPARFLLPAGGVFALALLVRLIYLAQLRGTPLADLLLIDSDTYDRFARQILAGTFSGENVYAVNVLYPWFVAAVYALGKGSLFLVFHVQAVLDSLACAGAAWIGARHFGAAAGLLAGILLALCGPLVFYTGALLTPTLVSALGVALLAALTAWQAHPQLRWAILAGSLLGLATLARGNNALFLPLALPGFLLTGGTRRAGLAAWLVFAVCALVPLALVTARNLAITGHAVPVAANYAAFYVGHNAGANGLYVLPRWAASGEYADEVWGLNAALAKQVGHPMSLAETAQWLFAEGLRWARAHPAEELRLALAKFAFFWNAIEPPTNLSFHFARAWSALLRVLVIDMGVLAPLGLLGAWWGRGRARAFLLAWGLVALLTALLFFVSAEYRLPVLPVLAIFAGHALVTLERALRGALPKRAPANARARLLVTAALALPLLFALTHLKPAPLAAQARLEDDYTKFGTLAARRGDLARARALYERATVLAPGHGPAWQGLASVLERGGDEVGALRAARRARGAGIDVPVAAPTPASAIADSGLAAVALFQAGDLKGARAMFERLEPRARAAGDTSLAAGLLNNAGLTRFRLGDLDGAARAFERVLAERPAAVKAHYNLARVRVAQGRIVEAEAEYETALRIDPNAPGVRAELAALRARQR